MKVEVRTERYEWSYGRKPKGYGFWAFDFNGETVWFQGMYTEAKKKAVKEAKEHGITRIYVLP